MHINMVQPYSLSFDRFSQNIFNDKNHVFNV